MKTLFVLSHPTFNESFANQIIWHGLHELMPAAEFVHLDAAYPHLPIDVAKEQARLAAADVIVMQFLMFWYSVPGLMKRWIDDVFVHGFAHGSQGNKLHVHHRRRGRAVRTRQLYGTHDGRVPVSAAPLGETVRHGMAALCAYRQPALYRHR